ncbi:MAG: endonuclease/exonuclease/phosphatase family protein [Pseudomonadota bacterium]
MAPTSSNQRTPSVWVRLLVLAGFAYAVVFAAALVDRSAFLPTGWLFDLAAQLTPFLVVGGLVLALGFLGTARPGGAIIFGLIALVNLEHYARPGPIAVAESVFDPSADRVRLLSANIFQRSQALSNIAVAAKERDVDIIGIVEMPEADCSVLRQMFGSDWFCLIVDKDPRGVRLNRVSALVARWEPSKVEVHHDQAFGGRAIIEARFSVGQESVNTIVLHPLPPGSPQYTDQRNAVLHHAAQLARGMPNSVVMGDFNTTPWARTYRTFHGKRASDPRFHSTWLTKWPFLGLPIDHIILDDALLLGEMQVLSAVGSDHYPLFAEILLPADE